MKLASLATKSALALAVALSLSSPGFAAQGAGGSHVTRTEQDGVSVTTTITGDASSGSTTPMSMPKVDMRAISLYYSERVAPEAADKTARYLDQRQAIQGKDNIMLDKLADTYTLFVPTTPDKARDQQTLERYRQLAGMLSRDVFNNQPVRITLTDKIWHNLMESVSSQ